MSYLRVLHRYINIDLRDQLNFREKYSFPFLNDDKNIIYFIKDSTSHFDLKVILTSNKDLVIKLKQTFKEFLLREIEERNIKEVKLMIDDKPGKSGIGIIIVQEPVEMIDINPYVEILSHFDTEEQINEYCRTDKNTRNICGKKELWRGLIKKVYSSKYKHEYNYERLYKEYLKYKTYNIIKINGNIELFDRFNEYIQVRLISVSEIIKFLIFEGTINPIYYLDAILERLDIYNQEDLQKIIDIIRINIDKDEYDARLIESMPIIIGSNDTKIIATFLGIDFGPIYGYDWKIDQMIEYFRYDWYDDDVKIADEIKESIIKALPSNLSKDFEQLLEEIYDESVDEDDENGDG